MEMTEIKTLLDQQGEAFAAFKTTLETELKGKLAKDDPLVTEKLSKIEASLDTAVESKAALESAIAAEKKEREALEGKLNRMGFSGTPDEGKRVVELKEFNATLRGLAADRGKSFVALDEAGFDAYKAANERFLREGKDALSQDEIKTLSVGSDADGGYFVTPDVGGRIVKKVYETSPIRQIANVQTISTDALEGIEDLDEASVGYAGEHNLSGENKTPQIGKWRIPVFWIDTEPKTTQQLLDDSAVDIEAWLSGKVASKFARFEGREYVSGATKIRGFTSYETAADDGSGVAWGKIGHVVSGGAGAFAAANPADRIFDLIGTLKEAYLANARFVTRRSLITAVRKFKDKNDNYLWQPSLVLGEPERLAGFAITRAEDMPALADGSLSLAFGDFNEGYQIVDRQGLRVIRDHLTSKPYVKFYTSRRTGGGVVNFEAIKAMKFSAA